MANTGGKMIYTKNEGGSWGVYAQQPAKQGETVYVLRPFLSRVEPTRTSIQIRDGFHVEDKVGQYINHSFNPTCKIEGFSVVALRDIAWGEEITFDYTLNESVVSSPFVCKETGNPVGEAE